MVEVSIHCGTNGSSNSPSTSLGALVSELGAGVKFDASQLSQAAKEWLDARVTEQVFLAICTLQVTFLNDCLVRYNKMLHGRMGKLLSSRSEFGMQIFFSVQS
ncbi:unnamed protein product [Brugia pahangi]|uniref:NPH3 domain-containing protein n=1 Tax=Brugia pahangi TaxID=6280 RepID=A0A0N4TFH6_BRUPA|nr:unnamed protein product [Brugia pahangi]